MLLDAADGGAEPIAEDFFDFQLLARFIQGSERLSGGVEGNVPAGNLFGSAAGRDEGHEKAGAAGLKLVLVVKIHAGESLQK